MTNYNLFEQYIWLVETIASSPDGLTFEEINEKFQARGDVEYNVEYPKRTFHAQRDAIFAQFGIEIKCNVKDGYRYVIDYGSEKLGGVKKSLISSILVNNALKGSPELQDRIIVSNSFNPQCLTMVLKAIQQSKKMVIRHFESLQIIRDNDPLSKDVKDIDNTEVIEPYGLMFRFYWFLVANVQRDSQLHVFKLDNIIESNILEETFTIPRSFNLQDYSDNYRDPEFVLREIQRRAHSSVFDDISAYDWTFIEGRER